MKRIATLTTIIVAFSVLTASAQYRPSVLNLRLSDNSPFRVYVDGQQAGEIGNAVKVANLSGGKHYLEVIRVGNSWGRHYHHESAFRGSVMLTPNAESWVTVYPERQQLNVDEIRAFAEPTRFNPGRGKHFPKLPVHEQCETEVQHQYPTPVPVGPCAMNPNDFNQLQQTLNNADFESTRLNIFKQALAYNYFSTSQVRELMHLFWFEGTKLEVAKLAYPKTVDQNNYYLVNNEFSFSSSVNALGDYIAMR
jgi:hypothetical protein